MDLADKVRKRRIELGLSQEELAFEMGYKSRTSINKIEGGRPVTQKIIYRLAQALNVSPAYLMGWTDDPINYDDGDLIASIPLSYLELCDGDVRKAYALQQAAWEDSKNIPPSEPLPANCIPVKRVQVPMLGGIAAGEPILAEQQYDAYVEADADLDCTYALRVDGDSMEPTVRYGDIVFIRQQEDVDDGRIAAVLVDDSATLKRVYHIPNGLQLLSDNAAKYPPRAVTFEDYDCIRILGLAVAFKRSL